MAEGVDIASAVGTWLAAVLALVALFGIIGPFLLWTTLRSEKHIAHRAIDDPSHRFVSSGIRIWRDTRILRRARVPRLTDIPQLPRQFNGQRKDDCLIDPPRSKDRSGHLMLGYGHTWLPAHKLWVLVLGLLGRYSNREDKGQVIVDKSNTRLDYDRDVGEDERDVLHGSIGPLRRCLPLGNKVFDLSMTRKRFRSRSRVSSRRRSSTSGDSEDSRSNRSSIASTNPESEPEPEAEHTDEDAGAAQVGEEAQEAIQRRWESERYAYEGLEFYYLEQMEDILPTAKWTMWANAMGCDMEAVHTIEQLEISNTNDTQVMASILDSVPSKRRHDRLKRQLDEQVGMAQERIQNTTGPWMAVILLACDMSELQIATHRDAYIRRVDLQSMALAALSVPVTRRHFLFNSERSDSVFSMLTVARFKQRKIVDAVKRTLPHWHLDKPATTLEQLLQDAEKVRVDGGHSRRDTEVLCQLDSYISTIWRGSRVVGQCIGVLYLTSHDFRSFIDELAEHSSIHVDMALDQVEAVAASGEQTTWSLDFAAVFPAATLPTTRLPRTRVELKDLMLAALQAWVRITWFAQPIDARPLISFVDALSDMVHVAADTQPPRRHRSIDPILGGGYSRGSFMRPRHSQEEMVVTERSPHHRRSMHTPPQNVHVSARVSPATI
ncbi:hypothetical protein COCC4DRAFT_75279 [Bipolaris maydis ATCC 48331]|uniref:Uncharacterized protein n=2 Tax=Cochliobolus heterostrophus TaxID=5016 RepID=M2TA24_COCH5|nr:uncharacterized protein COCC4DRAFT_75279 [Bipolaris maydis ATCC 48331]EMD94385.1 hypothetical protein COCHEDRAFT_1170328 [Bipolaris maydis C5]ENI01275.1 hypothetical protein COCC4DRAFT_75279 [Bipolaris maydis ATCC 48331]KAJ6209810.1 hypothetical protein PSV09DRAFT_1170328 [Bipolaris maydis]KAJ6282737.1 hypothetical protein J3E71DRAFT_216783 [Bipolaris maydis]